MLNQRIAVLIIPFLLVSMNSESAELNDEYLSVRAAGQGNSYTALVSDNEALLINPAALARSSGFHWTIFGLGGGVDGVDVATTLAKQSQGSTFADTLNQLYGKNLWGGASGFTALSLGSFAIGGYANGNLGFNLHNPAYPNLNVNYQLDYGILMGLGIDLIPKIWMIGGSIKRVFRLGSSAPIGPSILASLNQASIVTQLGNQGVGYGADAGMIVTIPVPVEPTLSVVYRNMGDTSFAKTAGAASPPPIPGNLIVGGAIRASLPLISLSPSIDYHYVNRADVELGKRIHMGLELSLPIVAVRAGINQGYWTLGAGFNLGMIRIDAASYGVELGEYAGQKEDRRYVANLTVELGFDPSGLFSSGKSGKGNRSYRNLKQRR